jgi:alpha-1,2-mannosyltransferase
MTPYMMDYDLVILALPIAWIALEGARSGFLPWEKSLLALAWLLPLFARSLAGHALIPIAPLVTLLLADIARRAMIPCAIVPLPSSSGKESRQCGASPAGRLIDVSGRLLLA